MRVGRARSYTAERAEKCHRDRGANVAEIRGARRFEILSTLGHIRLRGRKNGEKNSNRGDGWGRRDRGI